MNEFFINKEPKDTKVVVAMSGGVDSSTVAAWLYEKGYQVIGITLQLYDLGVTLEKKGACCAGQDIYDAKSVADKLGFPHYVLNYESLFKQSVMEEFADSYLRGETPIPCVRCNQSVKFRDLLKVAKDLGADALATGHYVRRINGEHGAELLRAVDYSKDQSYFLFATTKEQLEYLHFPLGGMTKVETRALAVRLGLEIADKPDSQDICFVPNGSYTKVIEKLRPGALDAGEIVHLDGRVLGTHNGIINYTIGQRKGLGIASAEPLYVIKLDAQQKKVIVGPESALANQRFKIKEINWLAGDSIPEGIEVTVKLRSAHAGARATIGASEGGITEILLSEPERAITPGQACVMYDGDRVLGGGWITALG
jgi:tRNA-uridine 2-sulfurtransferase